MKDVFLVHQVPNATHPPETQKLVPVSQGYKYLLVTIDTFTGWIEGFPAWTKKAEEVVKTKQTKKTAY